MLKFPKPEKWLRLVCRIFGHRLVEDTRGKPVSDPVVCTRCGKWWRRRD